MDLFLKITIVLLVILLAVLLILYPCREYFESALSSKSSVIYTNNSITTDEEYLQKINPGSNDLLLMYRCIEFKKGGIENTIATLKMADNFFISNKYETYYTDFSTIEELIKTSILKLHSDYQQKMYGPIYLLITQYPLYNSISADCIRTTQSSPLENNFSPIVQTIDDKCKDLAHPEKLIRCEFYILMPSHQSNGDKVGLPNNASWDVIKSNMGALFTGNSYINNVRSQDKQCFTKCGEIQVDGYMCGARNGDTPYKSEVFNTPINNLMEKTHSDYANLYIINKNGINNLLGMTSDSTNIIEEGVRPEAIPIYPTEEPASIVLPPSNTNDSINIIPHIDKSIYDQQQKELQEERERLEKQRLLEYMSDIEARCYLMRYRDLRIAFGNNIESAKTHWVNYGISESRTKECDYNQFNLMADMADGLSEETAAPSAKHILDTYGTTENGVYWINLPFVGPTKVYCIMDPNCSGGGWMLAMKGVQGTTFKYESVHWTSPSTLNDANPSPSEGDAKYNVFNYYKAVDWFAGFPDVPTHTGDVSRNVYNGFTWVENNAANSVNTLLEVFSANTRIVKSINPKSLAKFNSGVWSSQNSFQFYGINYRGGNGYKSRWGFGWNENRPADNERSNDAGGGIGTEYYSAGDRFSCCGVRGLNRRMRFEFYVR